VQRRLIAILILLVCLPLVLLAWLGVRLARNEQELLDQRVEELLETRLRDMDSRIQQLLDARARALLTLTDVDSYDAGELRALIRSAPEIDHLFVQAETGRVLHPPVAGELSRTERDFLVRTRTIFDDRLLWQATGATADTAVTPTRR